MNTKTLVALPVLSVLAVAIGLATPTSAIAGSRKRVEIQFQNNASTQSMRCTLVQTWGSASAPKTKTVGRYVIRGNSTRPESQRHLPLIKQAWISPVVRRMSGEYVYPKLQMTCALDDNSHQGGETTSMLWDHEARSFDEHHLWATCADGARCGVVIE